MKMAKLLFFLKKEKKVSYIHHPIQNKEGKSPGPETRWEEQRAPRHGCRGQDTGLRAGPGAAGRARRAPGPRRAAGSEGAECGAKAGPASGSTTASSRQMTAPALQLLGTEHRPRHSQQSERCVPSRSSSQPGAGPTANTPGGLWRDSHPQKLCLRRQQGPKSQAKKQKMGLEGVTLCRPARQRGAAQGLFHPTASLGGAPWRNVGKAVTPHRSARPDSTTPTAPAAQADAEQQKSPHRHWEHSSVVAHNTEHALII